MGRGIWGFILGYRVHTVCCAKSEPPLAFTVSPYKMNDKPYFKPLLERMHSLVVKFKVVLTDVQYNSGNVREAAEDFIAMPIMPVRRDSRHRDALMVEKDFMVRGARRLVGLVRKQRNVEGLLNRKKEWLMLGNLRLLGLE